MIPSPSAPITPAERRTRYGVLLTSWCDALLDLQVRDSRRMDGLRGGILCPACSRIHGRSADAVYPLLYQAHTLQSDRHRDAAVQLLRWSAQVTTSDGAFLNEPTADTWKGITVFSLLALGEALRHHGEILQERDREEWRDRLRRGSDFLMGFLDSLWKSNINYPISASAALAVAADVLGDAAYRQRAHDLLRECLPYLGTENTLLFGEGKPMDGISPRGCRAVDLGYNVEESLPNLALASHLLGDNEARTIAVRSLQSHLEFLLPDGAWDNSWGSRSFKWTYWGSRTSDGCQSAFALLADEDARFLPAADLNLALLESCTHDGILYGGPHLREEGYLPCIHHTFCHAKALAAALDTPALQSVVAAPPREHPAPVALPRTAGEIPVRVFPEIATGLIALGPWRATVTAYDWKYRVGEEHPSGGSLSLLWHETIGPIFAASMTIYRELEPSNMQPWRGLEPPHCLTPQIALTRQGTVFHSVLDNYAEVAYAEHDAEVLVTVRGHLTEPAKTPPRESLRTELVQAVSRRLRAVSGGKFSGLILFDLNYRFNADGVEITAVISGPLEASDSAVLELPVIAAQRETVKLMGDRQAVIEKPFGQLTVEATAPFASPVPPAERVFNPVPGFQAYPIRVPILPGQETTVRLSVR